MAKRAPGAVCMRHEATWGAPPRLCGHRSTVAGHLVVGRRSSVPLPPPSLPPLPAPLHHSLAPSPRTPYICHDPWPSPPMSEPSPRNRRTANPDGMVVVVRDHLRTLLMRTATPFPCSYACFVHPRRRAGEQGFGVITLAGESLALTVIMLESLKRMPTLLEGVNPVVLGAADEEDVLVLGEQASGWREPLPVNRLMLWQGVTPGGEPESLQAQSGILLSPRVGGPQLTLLCAQRPTGWPA